MRNSAYFLISLIFMIISVAALVIAILYDALDNESRSVVFGCVSCACAVPAFSSASIFMNLAKEGGDTEDNDDDLCSDGAVTVEGNDE